MLKHLRATMESLQLLKDQAYKLIMGQIRWMNSVDISYQMLKLLRVLHNTQLPYGTDLLLRKA